MCQHVKLHAVQCSVEDERIVRLGAREPKGHFEHPAIDTHLKLPIERFSFVPGGSHQYFPTGAESPINFPMGLPAWPLDFSPVSERKTQRYILL